MIARLLIIFAALFLLLSFSSARRPLDFPAIDVGDDSINGLSVVGKGGLPESRNKATLLLPSEKPESDPSESVAGKDVPLPTSDTIPGEIEEKNPVNSEEMESTGPEIVSARPEEKEEDPDAEERMQRFRSIQPLMKDNIHPIIPFRPINRHWPHDQMPSTFPMSRFPHRFHHHHHHQISIHPFDQERREEMPIRDFSTRWVEFHKVNDEFSIDNRDAMTIGEFKGSFHRGHRDGMMIGEFKGPNHFVHRLPCPHLRHHFNHGERVEVEGNEPVRERIREEKDDDVLMKIRKFLTHF